MEEVIISLMNQFGYVGIMFLIMIENVFPPIPSEIILCFGGFMTTTTEMTVLGVVIASTVGSLLGAVILYMLGRILNKERLIKIVNGKIGKILRLKARDIEMADHWFDTKGNITVFFCRFIPIVRSLISIPAGMSEMPFIKFMMLTTIGTLIWNTVLTILGSIMGENWVKIVEVMDKFSSITLVVLVIVFIVVCLCFYKFIYKKRKDK